MSEKLLNIDSKFFTEYMKRFLFFKLNQKKVKAKEVKTPKFF